MATNYTSNYQLCQWEADDQVNRLEFNQDNSRIEDGLVDLLGKLEEVKSTITSNVASLEQQISQVSGSINTLEQSLSTVEGKVSTVESSVSTLQSNYTTMNSSLKTAETNVTTLQSNYSTMSTSLTTTSTTASEAYTLASSAYSPDNPNILLGYYTGTGVNRYMSFGFATKISIVVEDGGNFSSTISSISTNSIYNTDTKEYETNMFPSCYAISNGLYVSGVYNTLGKRYIVILLR